MSVIAMVREGTEHFIRMTGQAPAFMEIGEDVLRELAAETFEHGRRMPYYDCRTPDEWLRRLRDEIGTGEFNVYDVPLRMSHEGGL